MCFLPLGCLKFITGVGAIGTIVIALGLLALTIYANLEKKQIISNIGGSLVTNALVGLYLGAAIFMVLGICGIYGAIKSRKRSKNSGNCLLFFYFIGVTIFFLIFLGGTIFLFVGPEMIFGTDCTHGAKTNLIRDLYNIENQAINNFCKADCACYMNPNNTGSELARLIRDKGGVISQTNQTLKNYRACMSPAQNQSAEVVLMASLEELLDCAGWCENQEVKFFKFTDINQCTSSDCLKSRKGCHDSMQDFIKGKGRLVGFGCIIATAVCIINMITICCICNHPSKRGKGSNFYARMMDQE